MTRIPDPLGTSAIESPDRNAAHLMSVDVDPLRYDGHTDEPTEVAGILRGLMPSNVRVLDVGCGTGSVTLIANHGKKNEVVAIEPDPDRVTVARSRGLEVYHGFLNETFLQHYEPFDVVMASDVLEHVAAPADLLALMTRATRPGGTLLISVPNVAHWSVRLNLLFGRFDLEPHGIMDATHLRWFTARTATDLLESNGGKVTSISQTVGLSMAVYNRGFFELLPFAAKTFVVKRLARVLPLVFGAQHVLSVRTPKQPGAAQYSEIAQAV